MTGLKEGDEYQCRVVAVNDIGPSEPSRPSAPILVEEQPNKPCMDLGGVRDITVRAGEDFSIHVPFLGFPLPTASWFKDDTILDDTDSRIHRQVLHLPIQNLYYYNLHTNVGLLYSITYSFKYIL